MPGVNSLVFSFASWQEIVQSISKNRLRTLLSGFTVALGIFIFVVLFGLGNGLKNSFATAFSEDATNLFYVSGGRTTLPFAGYKSSRKINLNNDDVSEVASRFSAEIAYIYPRISRSVMISHGTQSNFYQHHGVGPEHRYTEKLQMLAGRFINQADVRERSKYAVIGRLVELDLFAGTSALGQFISLGGSVFKVVGVFKDAGGDNDERNVFIPYSTRQALSKNTDDIDRFILAFSPSLDPEGVAKFEQDLSAFLQKKHHVHPKDATGIRIHNVAQRLEKNRQFASLLQIIVSVVGLGTLMAGVIGISNMMIFVVKERTRELGVRKALGATPNDILALILQESIFITAIAGYIGLLGGVLLLNSLGNSLEAYFIKNPAIDLSTGIIATVLIIICGAIAGYVPAQKAASIKPITALQD
jgi:putative ABC transport system permease protein